MLYYQRTDLSKSTDLAKSNNIKECVASNYWYFNNEFRFPNAVENGCHNVTMLCLNLSDIAMITIKCIDYLCIIHDISKSEAINMSENYVLGDCGYI